VEEDKTTEEMVVETEEMMGETEETKTEKDNLNQNKCVST